METPGTPPTPPPVEPPAPSPAPEPPAPPQGPTFRPLELVSELAELMLPAWPRLRLAARASGLVAEGEGGGEGGGSGEGGEGGGSGSGEGEGAGGGSGEGGEGEGAQVTMSKADHDRLQEAVATANREARDAKRRLEQASEEGKKKGGKFEELYNEANAKVDRITNIVGQQAVRSTVEAVAKDLKFRNPAIAHRLIDLDGVEANVDLSGDEPKVEVDKATRTIIEKRLNAAAESDGYLLEEGRPGQLPGAGQGGGGGGGGGQGGNAAMNAAIRRAAGRAG